MSNFTHTPVLLTEAVEALSVHKGGKYIDATLGGGGHTSEILKRGALVLGIDQDNEALEFVKQELGARNDTLRVVKGNFRNIKTLAAENGFEEADGILFDIGVSSHQLDTPERGFGIRGDEALDMRMDRKSPLTAYEVVNKYPRERLIEIFYKYGEDHNAKDAAQAIIEARKKKEITTAFELAQLLMTVPHKSEPIHPATRVFQAIRIEVNDELQALKEGLDQALGVLGKKGRLVVISFHSLEDRIVKQAFTRYERTGKGKIVNKKPIVASFSESKKNRRSRSAKMRVFETYE